MTLTWKTGPATGHAAVPAEYAVHTCFLKNGELEARSSFATAPDVSDAEVAENKQRVEERLRAWASRQLTTN